MAKKIEKKSEENIKNDTKINENLDNDKGPSNKKIDIYKNALKRTLKTGTENIDEDPVLGELRNTLKINNALHQKLKEEVKAELEKVEQILKESKLKITKTEKKITELKKKLNKENLNKTTIFTPQ